MTEYVEVGTEVILYTIEDTLTQDGVRAGTHYCYTRKLIIDGGDTATVNTPLPLIVKLLTWQDQPTTEDKEIKVTANGQEVVLQLVNGQGEFDFESAVAGQFNITAHASNINIGEKAVTVS